MKKNNNNNQRRNNNGYNPNYSLNYKFDSNSPAGKICGTALELIKRYNDLAKDAYSNNDFITSEVYRQYAEHYRKIVTDINERRGFNANRKDYAPSAPEEQAENKTTHEEPAEVCQAQQPVAADTHSVEKPMPEKREFKVIEISEAKEVTTPKPKRTYRRKTEEATAL